MEESNLVKLLAKLNTSSDELDDANVKWAEFCIRNMTGALLQRGLGVSIALAEFCAELGRENRK